MSDQGTEFERQPEPMVQMTMNLGRDQQLSRIGGALEDLEAVYSFGVDLTFLSLFVQGSPLVEIEPSRQALAEQLRPSVAQVQRLVARLERFPESDRASVYVDWWLGLPGGGRPKLVRPPATRFVSYENPITVVIATTILIAQGVVWTVGKVQEIQLRNAELRKTQAEAARANAETERIEAETVGVRLDNLKKMRELGLAQEMTQELVRQAIPELSAELVSAIARSDEGQAASRAIGKLPQIVEEPRLLEG